MRLPVNRITPLAALVILAACGGNAPPPRQDVALSRAGPAGDYPVVIGDPYVIAGITHTPIDRMNYDAVGHAVMGSEGGTAITAAHHTLPLPSYVEVTALATGRTILVRIERRGPMSGNELIELSPGAAAQLGVANEAAPAVRVRRVNPPEIERAALRTGGQAPARMDTPKSLAAVLQRKLDQQDGVAPKVAVPAEPAPEATVAPLQAPVKAKPATAAAKAKPPSTKPSAPPSASPSTAAKDTKATTPTTPAKPAAAGSFVIQIGAYSTESRAAASASKVGGTVAPSGKLWRVRAGPFTTRAEADAALAKVKAAGYSDARIQRAD